MNGIEMYTLRTSSPSTLILLQNFPPSHHKSNLFGHVTFQIICMSAFSTDGSICRTYAIPPICTLWSCWSTCFATAHAFAVTVSEWCYLVVGFVIRNGLSHVMDQCINEVVAVSHFCAGVRPSWAEVAAGETDANTRRQWRANSFKTPILGLTIKAAPPPRVVDFSWDVNDLGGQRN